MSWQALLTFLQGRTRARATHYSSVDLLEANVLVLGPHGCAGVELEGDDAFRFRELGMVVGAVEDQATVSCSAEDVSPWR